MVSDRYFGTHIDELADLLEDEMKHQAAGGFTTIASHIQGGLAKMPTYTKLVREGRMPQRLAFAHRYCQQVEPNMAGCVLRLGDWAGLGDKYFWNVGITLGALDNGPPPTICTTMEAPPEFKAQEMCNLQPDNGYWKTIYTTLASRYRYVVNHNYGDKSIDRVMDIMEKVMKDNPDITLDFMRSRRVSSDHCGFYLRKDQIARAKNLGMMFSCNSNFLNRSAPWLKVYGADKANRITPMGSMIKGGLMVTAEFEQLNWGSGEGPTEAAWIHRFITRKNDRGEILAPEEAIDRVQSIKMTTVWSSYYVLKEKELGTLEPGKLADLVVFNKDYFTVPDAEFPTVFPLMTVVGGKPIVLREEFAKELGVTAIGPQIKFKFKTEYDFGPEAGQFMKRGGA